MTHDVAVNPTRVLKNIIIFIAFTVKVAQLFAGVLFPFQVYDSDNDARQHDD